jgi:hypothetical protein
MLLVVEVVWALVNKASLVALDNPATHLENN